MHRATTEEHHFGAKLELLNNGFVSKYTISVVISSTNQRLIAAVGAALGGAINFRCGGYDRLWREADQQLLAQSGHCARIRSDYFTSSGIDHAFALQNTFSERDLFFCRE
jgi:hypothetical protein